MRSPCQERERLGAHRELPLWSARRHAPAAARRPRGSPQGAQRFGDSPSRAHPLPRSRGRRRGPAIGERGITAPQRLAPPAPQRGRVDSGSRRSTGGLEKRRGPRRAIERTRRFGDPPRRAVAAASLRDGGGRGAGCRPHRICLLSLLRFSPARPGLSPAAEPREPHGWPRGRGAPEPLRDPRPLPAHASPARAGPGRPEGPLDLAVSPCQVCARTMGAALGTGARLTLRPGRACGAVRSWAPPAPARGCHSKARPARPVPLKKRGYDITRNPHLNKVTGREGRRAQAALPGLAGWAPRPRGAGRSLPDALPGEAWCDSVWLFSALLQLGKRSPIMREPDFFTNKYRLG